MKRSYDKEKSFSNHVKKANDIYHNKYDYSKFVFFNLKSKSIIICPTHGNFECSFNDHLYSKKECKKCTAPKFKQKLRDFFIKSKEQFVKEANIIHNYKYDYSLSEYNGSFEKMEIFCTICKNIFLQRPDSHINKKSGCTFCSLKRRITNEIIDDFIIKKSFKRLENVINKRTKIEFQCLVCDNIWKTIPELILRGCGCPVCNKPGKTEKYILNLFNVENIKLYHDHPLKIIDQNEKSLFRVDFYFPHKKIIIEYNGEQHYAPARFGGMSKHNAVEKFKKQKDRDDYVKLFCIKHEIKFMEIDARIYREKKLDNYIKNEIIPMLKF